MLTKQKLLEMLRQVQDDGRVIVAVIGPADFARLLDNLRSEDDNVCRNIRVTDPMPIGAVVPAEDGASVMLFAVEGVEYVGVEGDPAA